jgi:hypothetical protein
MAASRTRRSRSGPGFTRVTCDYRQPNGDGCHLSTPTDGDTAEVVRRFLREAGWARINGKDWCPHHRDRTD